MARDSGSWLQSSARQFLLRASDHRFPWLQSDDGGSWSDLKSSLALILAVGLCLIWGFPPEHASLCGQAPPSMVSAFQEGCRTWRLPVSEGLGPETGVASLTYVLLVRLFQGPDSRRGDTEHHWLGGVSKNLGATFKNKNTKVFWLWSVLFEFSHLTHKY